MEDRRRGRGGGGFDSRRGGARARWRGGGGAERDARAGAVLLARVFRGVLLGGGARGFPAAVHGVVEGAVAGEAARERHGAEVGSEVRS